MAVSIEFYSDWMKEQIIVLFCNQYQEDKNEFSLFFDQFYENDFQKDKAIKIVAVDGEKVVGFQSFFYWPYQKGIDVFNSFQSGNSLVHPDYRGQGLFKRMLEFIYSNQAKIGIDFMVGFPVQASFNSFIRNKWVNLFNLQWYVKVVNYIAPIASVFVNPETKLKKEFELDPKYKENLEGSESIRLAESLKFKEWRKNYRKDQLYYVSFELGSSFVEFEFKYNVRKKIVGEIVIGNINTNSQDNSFLKESLTKLIKRLQKLNFVTLVSIAINEECLTLFNEEIKNSFKRIDKSIYFIIKGIGNDNFLDKSENWNVMRSDIDTW